MFNNPHEVTVYEAPNGKVFLGASDATMVVEIEAAFCGSWKEDEDGRSMFYVPGLRIKRLERNIIVP